MKDIVGKSWSDSLYRRWKIEVFPLHIPSTLSPSFQLASDPLFILQKISDKVLGDLSLACLSIQSQSATLTSGISALPFFHNSFFKCSLLSSGRPKAVPIPHPLLWPHTSFWQIFICSSNLGSSVNCLYPSSLAQIFSVCFVLDSVTYMLTYYIKPESLACLWGLLQTLSNLTAWLL